MTIGQRIKEARKVAGLTQRELAEKAGTATGTIQQYELGKRQPRIGQLQRIAAALEIHVSELLVTLPPEIAETLDFVENRGEKLFDLDKELHQSVMDGIRQACLPSPQERINLALNQLNENGLAVAAERVEELTEISRYRRQDASESTQAKDTTPTIEEDARAEAAEYYREILEEKKRAANGSASSGSFESGEKMA